MEKILLNQTLESRNNDFYLNIDWDLSFKLFNSGKTDKFLSNKVVIYKCPKCGLYLS